MLEMSVVPEDITFILTVCLHPCRQAVAALHSSHADKEYNNYRHKNSYKNVRNINKTQNISTTMF